jgi:hypothetical protein
VLAALHPVPPLQLAALLVKVVPPVLTYDCHRACCSGKRINITWQGAVRTIAEAVQPPIICRPLPLSLRAALVAKHYGREVTYQRIAGEYDLVSDTAAKYCRGVTRWLAGSMPRAGVQQVPGCRAETLLRGAGLMRS